MPNKKLIKGNNIVDLVSDYIVLDVEATGVKMYSDFLIEFCGLKVRDGKVVDSFQTLIKPRKFFKLETDSEKKVNDYIIKDDQKIYYVDSDINKLTGISNQMLKDAPDEGEIIEKILDFIDDDIIVGHSIDFDIDRLNESAKTFLNKTLTNDYIDTNKISQYLIDIPTHSLVNVSTYYGIEHDGAHRASIDCEMNVSVYEKQKQNIIEKHKSVQNFVDSINEVDKQKTIRRCKKSNNYYIKKNIPKKYLSGKFKCAVNNLNENKFFDGKICYVSGYMKNYHNDELKKMIISAGGYIQDKNNRFCDLVIMGNYNSKKQKKLARKKISQKSLKAHFVYENDLNGIFF